MMPFWLKILMTPTCFLFFPFLWHWLCRIGALGRNRLGGFSEGLTAAWLPGSPAGSSGWWTTRRQAEADRALGAQPCCRCGEWTHSWCERCKHPSPTPVCSRCDSHKLLCQKCTEAGLPYPEEVDQSGDIVVSGYHDAEGAFISLTPPVRVPQAEIPYTTAGEIDVEALVEKARRRSAEFTPRGSA